ncbi:DUF4862 family protein [Microbacterium lacus]|uniref:DUF4862 family protein n=1 Tax=Microbacterium lacus TaxID=415217 RepID=UPI00384CF063
MNPATIISAYAASPAHTVWDPELEAELLSTLCALPTVAGLEVPWMGALHPHDTSWFLQHVPAGAKLSITALPWVMQRCAAMPSYGLASRDSAGRAAAIADFRMLHADVHTLAQQSSAQIDFVAVHSAPHESANKDALAESLAEIATWDWGGARLIIEHCDAVRPGQTYEKGFLRLEDEIEVLGRVSADIGLWMNWGRSAIELRDADEVTAQIKVAGESGYLTGLTFSGAAYADGPYGSAWTDTHPPIAETDPDSASLLDTSHVMSAMEAAGCLDWVGVKVSRNPADRTAAAVTATVARNLDIVRRSIPVDRACRARGQS